VLHRLPVLDRYLPVWIGAAMATGLLLGRLVPGLDDALDAVRVGSVSLPIAIGLLAMMYPVLAKVRYNRIGDVTRDRRLLVPSLVLNWVIGPALMFGLAWAFLADLPEYRTGLIIVGLARCIAMVLIWSDLAGGDREAAAVLVAVNSLLQIGAYSLLGYFYLELLPHWLGWHTAALDVSLWEIAHMVLVFLGIPLAAGYLTRRVGVARRGEDWYTTRFLPRIGPVALYGLLATVVVLFALQGDKITSEPLDVARIAVPLLAYFALMWGSSFALGVRLGLGYPRTATLAFTAAGNNFELAIAVAIGVFGVSSGQAATASRSRSAWVRSPRGTWDERRYATPPGPLGERLSGRCSSHAAQRRTPIRLGAPKRPGYGVGALATWANCQVSVYCWNPASLPSRTLQMWQTWASRGSALVAALAR
jgi:arsenical-resistance protein